MGSIAVEVSPQPPRGVLDPAQIEFGKTCSPHMFMAEYHSGEWVNPRIQRVENFSLHPASTVFHYAQAIFEGLKAYRQPDGAVTLFRPEMNAKRFVASAERMGMPPVEPALFLEAVEGLSDLERDWAPPFPGSLYLRPTMIGTEPCLGVRSATEFLFYVLALPSGSYFKGIRTGAGAIRVLVADHVSRAAPGGTGNVKAAANYAVTLKTMTEARAAKCEQALFVDACRREFIEEMGGMNIFFVQGEQLLTPPVGDTILPGITRDSVMRIAPSLGLRPQERPLTVSEVVSGIQSGSISEVLACGTAAVVAAIREFAWMDGRTLRVGDGTPGPVTNKLLEALQGIQYGSAKDPFGWVRQVPELVRAFR